MAWRFINGDLSPSLFRRFDSVGTSLFNGIYSSFKSKCLLKIFGEPTVLTFCNGKIIPLIITPFNDLEPTSIRQRQTPSQNMQQLSTALFNERRCILQYVLLNLFESMKRRCDSVVPKRGGHTRNQHVIDILLGVTNFRPCLKPFKMF